MAETLKPVAWQFYQDGKWHNGMDTNNHRANTEAAGIPTRDLYPSATVLSEAEREAILSALNSAPMLREHGAALRNLLERNKR